MTKKERDYEMNKVTIRQILARMLIISLLAPSTVYAGQWNLQEQKWYYEENGKNKTGWIQENQNWYHLGTDGVMSTGWYQDEFQNRYYLNQRTDGVEGQMRTGWFLQDGTWFFLNTVHDGYFGRAIAGHWQWIDGYCYLFDEQGRMYSDCVTPDKYTVNEDGKWTVNGVAQYVPGKGILTTPHAVGGSSGGSSGGSGIGSHSGGQDSGGEGQQKEGTIVVSYKDRETDEVIRTERLIGKIGEEITIKHPQLEGYTVCTGQPDKAVFQKVEQAITVYYLKSGAAGKIVIQYLEQGTEKPLGSKTVVGKIGELYVFQYPVFEDHKRLENAIEETRFTQQTQTVKIYYRIRGAEEEADQSIVLDDNLKAIIPDSEEEVELVNQMREQIFDYNVAEDGTAELVVYHENPLLDYILDGTYRTNDIIYIEACEAFPAGLTLTYESHDDNYTGALSGYEEEFYEVIHGTQTGLLDLFEEGTYFTFDEEAPEIELAYIWTPMMSEAETMWSRERSAAFSDRIDFDKPEVTLDVTNEGTSLSAKFPMNVDVKVPSEGTPSNLELNLEPEIALSSEAFQAEFNWPWEAGPARFYLNAGFNGKLEIPVSAGWEGDTEEIMKKITERFKQPKNQIALKFLNVDAELSGIDFSETLIPAIVGFKVITHKLESNINDIMADGTAKLSIDPIISGMPFLEFHAEGSAGVTATIGSSWYNQLGFDLTFPNGKADVKNLCQYSKTKKEPEAKPTWGGEFGAEAKMEESFIGGGAGLGVSLFGLMPVLLKMPIGLECEGDISVKGKYELGGDPVFKLENVSGANFRLDLVSKVVSMLRLKGSLGNKVDLKVDLEKNWVDAKIPLLRYPAIEDSRSLVIKPDTVVEAVDEFGNNISHEFKGYDPVLGKVRVETAEDGSLSFECPRYIAETYGTKRRCYKITGIQTSSSFHNYNYDTLDLSRALDVESIELYDDTLKELLLPLDTKNIKEMRVSYHSLSWLDYGKCPNLEKIDLHISGLPEHAALDDTQKLDLSKNSKLKSIEISNYHNVKEICFPEKNQIESIYIGGSSAIERGFENTAFPSLKSLYIQNLDELKILNLEKAPVLEMLNVAECYNLKHLDVSCNPMLTECKTDVRLETFCGNGIVFPHEYKDYFTWYLDPQKTKRVTKEDGCAAGQTIYSNLYHPEETQSSLLTDLASPSNMELATASNMEQVWELDSAEPDMDVFDETWQEEEIELINDIELEDTSAPEETIPFVPEKQSALIWTEPDIQNRRKQSLAT